MPSTTTQKRQAAAVNSKAQEVHAEKKAVLASVIATNDLWNSLQDANMCIKELENLLTDKDIECHRLQSELDTANQKLHTYKESFAFWKAKHEKTYHELHMQCQTPKKSKKNCPNCGSR